MRRRAICGPMAACFRPPRSRADCCRRPRARPSKSATGPGQVLPQLSRKPRPFPLAVSRTGAEARIVRVRHSRGGARRYCLGWQRWTAEANFGTPWTAALKLNRQVAPQTKPCHWRQATWRPCSRFASSIPVRPTRPSGAPIGRASPSIPPERIPAERPKISGEELAFCLISADARRPSRRDRPQSSRRRLPRPRRVPRPGRAAR